MDSSSPADAPSPEQQAERIKATEAQCREEAIEAGTKTYLVSSTWFNAWCRHTGFEYDADRQRVTITKPSDPGPTPGPIDNADLLAEEQRPSKSALTEEEAATVSTLRAGLVEKRDFWAFAPRTWDLLKQWYGAKGPEIAREYMRVGMGGARLEMDPLQLHLKVALQPGKTAAPDATGAPAERTAIVAISELCTVFNLLQRATAAFGIGSDGMDVFDGSVDPPRKLQLNQYVKTLRGVNIKDQQLVLLRPRPAGTKGVSVGKGRGKGSKHGSAASSPMALPAPSTSPPSPMFGSSPSFLIGSPLSRSGGKAPSWAEDSIVQGTGKRRGLAGLANLGNTCFMNSSLQCLSHTLPVMKVFLTGDYKRDCNPDNPLGLGGKLAKGFGGLMEKLWKEGASYVSPKHFKWELAKFAPQFQGYAQQDSQELLAFLLDGLHEDLNRIRVKPYVEEKDADGRPDEEVAGEAWDAYRARNDSVIVDHFQGMYKSTLVCPSCQHCSVKFDPFMYLSVPLPEPQTYTVRVTALSMDGDAPPTQYAVTLSRQDTVREACAKVAALCLDAEREARWPQHLLLARWSPSAGGGELELLTGDKLKTRVTEALPAKPGASSSGFSLRGPRATHYLAYCFGGAALETPASRAVVVHHRADYSSLLPPTLLFVPEDELAGARLAKREGGATGLAAEGPFDLGPFLRPFQAETAAEEAASVASAPASKDMDVDGERPSSGVGPGAVTRPAEPMESDDQPLSVLEGLGSGSPDLVSRDLFSSSKATSSTNSLACSAALSTSSSADAPFVEGEADLEMEDAGAGDEPGDDGGSEADMDEETKAPESPPVLVTLKLANKEGRVRYSLGAGDESALPADSPLNLVAEWSREGAKAINADAWTSPARHASVEEAEAAARRPAEPLDLLSCVQAFLQREQLDAEDTWYCSRCKQHVQADKKLDLWSLPEVLVVHLKRFSYSRYSRDKLDTPVTFPLRDLDLSSHLLRPARPGEAPARYDLYAVSNHYGGMGGGHYTAYCKMPDDGLWYLFDDSSVRSVPDAQVQSPAAYVLFYRRQGSKVGLEEIFRAKTMDPAPSVPDVPLSPEPKPAPTIDEDLAVDPLHEELDIETAQSV